MCLAQSPQSRKAAKEEEMEENEVAKAIVDIAFQVRSTLGPGLLETVYDVILAHELRGAGFEVARQVPIPIIYKGVKFEEGFRADLIVAQCVIVELKSVDCLNAVHAKQLLTQLRRRKSASVCLSTSVPRI